MDQFTSPSNKSQRSSMSRLSVVNLHAAGIDLGSREHYVCAPPESCEDNIRTFGCYTADLRALARWLEECGVTTVAMEATGVYWIPVYAVLEQAGFEVLLVDARSLKHVKGRKTDVIDCQWLQELHRFGLLHAAFVPPANVRALRNLWRHREYLVEQAAHHISRMQKCLEQMNLQIHKVLSDISGVSGMAILRAIVAGERDPESLASLCRKGVKASKETMLKALEGNYQEELIFMLSQHITSYDFFHQQLANCDKQVEAQLLFLQEHPPETQAVGHRRKNQPHFDLRSHLQAIFGVDLTEIEGIDTLTAQVILSECGPDLSRFPTEKHFASWLGLAPNNRITGGKRLSGRTRRGNSRVATALRRSAQSVSRSSTWLGGYFRRMRGRHGAPKAITATARKLAVLVYRVAEKGMEYVKRGLDDYQEAWRQREMVSLQRRARELNLGLVDVETGVVME